MKEYPRSRREYRDRASTIMLQFLGIGSLKELLVQEMSDHPNFLMMAPLAMVRGIPATVPIAREMPMVSLVEPRSSRNQKK